MGGTLPRGLIAVAILGITACSTPVKRTTDGGDSTVNPGVGPQVLKIKTVTDADNPNPEVTEDMDSEILNLEEGVPPTVKAETPDTEGPEQDIDEEDLPAPVIKKHQIPFAFNQKVAEWIRYFSQKDRERFQRYLDRGEAYREVVENILEQNNVPADLYYLGLIESGFDSHAKSSAKAVGVWQFMRATGKLYGLGVDGYIDERKDPIRATEASAKYLRDLYRRFGSWYLALSAYNAGPGRIAGAIKRARSHDFWDMVARKKLPKETMEYVPKFLAARYIGERPDLFAFYVNEEKRYPDVQLVKVPSPLKFASIEQKCSMPAGTLGFVNPQYVMDYTHPGRSVDEIWVPTTYVASVEKQFESLKKSKIKVKPIRTVVSRPASRHAIHTVKRGETLKMIARNQGLSVAYLKRVNGLRSSKVIPGQKLKLSATEYRQKKAHPRNRKKRKGR